jgi:hypothetical protein
VLDAYPTPESDARRRQGDGGLPPALAAVPRDERGRLALVNGHFTYGIHAAFGAPCRYLTFLREPVARVISLYHHAHDHENHAMHPLIHDDGLSLRELLEADVNALEYDDAQTRLVAGFDVVEEFRRAVADDTEGVLRRAVQHLEDHFDVVGAMEAFDTSLLLAADRYGWDDVHYTNRNVTRRSRSAGRTAEVSRLIRAHNPLDVRLYEYAKERLRRDVRRAGPGFRARLFRFECEASVRALRRKLQSIRARARRSG